MNVTHQQALFVFQMGRTLAKLSCYSTNILRLWNFPSGIIICEWIPSVYNGKAWNHTRLGCCYYSFSRFILLTVKLRSCFTVCCIPFFMYCMVYAFDGSLLERAFCLWNQKWLAITVVLSPLMLCVFCLKDNYRFWCQSHQMAYFTFLLLIANTRCFKCTCLCLGCPQYAQWACP